MQGPLYRAAGWIYVTVVLTAIVGLVPVAVLILPAVLALTGPAAWLTQIVGLVMLGPLLGAALFALDRERRIGDLAPLADLARGVRLGAVDILGPWTGACLFAGALLLSLATLDGVGRILALVLGALGAVWAVLVVVIGTHFRFRMRDRVRLALYYLCARPAVALQIAALGILAWWAAGMADLAPWLCAGLFVRMLAWVIRPVVADATDRFTTEGAS
jgi:hypothetical protein